MVYRVLSRRGLWVQSSGVDISVSMPQFDLSRVAFTGRLEAIAFFEAVQSTLSGHSCEPILVDVFARVPLQREE